MIQTYGHVENSYALERSVTFVTIDYISASNAVEDHTIANPSDYPDVLQASWQLTVTIQGACRSGVNSHLKETKNYQPRLIMNVVSLI